MKLDVVVPTYNRSELLRRTVTSLFRAVPPPGLDVTIIVVDNNSRDNTEQVVREMQVSAPLPLVYVRERKQGSSSARNAGIAAGHGDIIGFIDDDEEVDRSWYEVVAREFRDSDTSYIGGPYLANYAASIPDWLPPGYHAAIGVVEPKPRSLFGPGFSGNLMGGNAVIRRPVFGQVGTYSAKLGRSGKGLLSEEDAEFYRRLMVAEIKGFHVPDLIIYHYIPAERLTRSYHRRWCFWRGVSQGLLDKEKPQDLPYAFGIPRYMIGRALRGLLSAPLILLRGRRGEAFAGELALWDLMGCLYGKHWAKPEKLYN